MRSVASYERQKSAQRRRRREDPEYRERMNAGARARRAANPDAMREWKYRARYGLTLAEVEGMIAAQDGKCAICVQPETAQGRGGNGPKLLAVDHDAETGRIRGMLCSRCNTALGALRHSPALLQDAIAYLEHEGDQRHRELGR